VLDLDFSGFTLVHHLDSSLALTSKGRTVCAHVAGGIARRVRLPFQFPRDLAFGFRILERLLRADKCLVVPHAGSVIIIRGGHVYRWCKELKMLGKIQGDCPLHASSCIGSSGALYFGEYFMNPERGPVKILKLEPGADQIFAAHVFPAGQIRHVHGIYKDPYHQGRLWVTVGDNDGECYLHWTDDEFVTLNRVGDGSQQWRAVGLVFTSEKVIWGTDSPHQPNYFVSLDRHSGRLELGQPVDGTVWYAGTTSDGVFFASSSVEKGPGVTTDQARVYLSRDGVRWESRATFTKDALPMPLFKWGTISFPSGSFPSNRIWISGEALCRLDGVSRWLT
jgi:hypothetical protein